MHKRGFRILVVDENPDIRHMVCRVLEALHHKAISAASAGAAARRLDGEPFGLVVINKDASHLRTKEARDSFERNLPGLGVIILCADLIGRSPRRSEVGRHVCIPMPFTMQMLQQAIDVAFDTEGSRGRAGN